MCLLKAVICDSCNSITGVFNYSDHALSVKCHKIKKTLGKCYVKGGQNLGGIEIFRGFCYG